MGETKIYKGKFIPKHETEADWNKSNYVPDESEIVIYDPDESFPAPRQKIGDGKKKVSELPFSDDALRQQAMNDLVPRMHLMDEARIDTYEQLGTYYFSEENWKKFIGDPNDSTNYPGYQRVYTERSRERGAYNMYAMTPYTTPVYNAWYSKTEWAERFAKEHPGETFREPYDDEYPVLDSSVMRLNTGDIIVPDTPNKGNSAVSKNYVTGYVSDQKSEKNVLKGYTPAERVVAINKIAEPGSWTSLSTSFVKDGDGGEYYIFDADLYIDTHNWGSAGIQISFITPITTWLMLNKQVNSALHYTDSDSANRKFFNLNNVPFVNNYVHLRLVYYAGAQPYNVCYLNGKEVARKEGGTSAPTRVQFACTKDYRGKVKISNARAVITDSLDKVLEHIEPTYLGVTSFEEELSTNNAWRLTKTQEKDYFVNQQYLEDYCQGIIDDISLEPDEKLDQAYTQLSSSQTRNFNYYITDDATPVIVEGLDYQKDGGYYKERFPEQTVQWVDVKDQLSSYLTDPTPSSGAMSLIEHNALYNQQVLKITKNIDGADGAGDKFLFLPQTANRKGKKFVFETEISWDGITSNAGSGNWCGRIRFVNSSKVSMWKNDNDCDIGFSGDSFSIAPSANYVAANKVATTSTWALLRLEMIDQTLVVFVNDKEVYRKTATNNLSTNNTALGGVTLEFREIVRGTTFYFNNTFVGTLNDDFFGRAIPSIPKRLEDGNINVPTTPKEDKHAVPKIYVDTKYAELYNRQSRLDSNFTNYTDEQRNSEYISDCRMAQLEDLLIQPTEGLTFEEIGEGYVCTGGAEGVQDIIIPSFYNGKPVIVLEANCFNNRRINSITIPATVQSILYGALYQAAKTVLFKNKFFGGMDSERPVGSIVYAEYEGLERSEECYMFEEANIYYLTDEDTAGMGPDLRIIKTQDTFTEKIYVRNNYFPGASWGAKKATVEYGVSLIKLP